MPDARLTVALALSALALASEPGSSQSASAPVEVLIPFDPRPLVSRGKTHFAYELHMTNFYPSTGNLRLERLEVMTSRPRPGAPSSPLVTLEGAELARRVVQPRVTPPPGDPSVLPGGKRAVVYLWVTLPAGAPVPSSLGHRLAFRTDNGALETVDEVRVDVRRPEPAVLGPLFRSGNWLVVNGPGNHQSHHWGGLLAANGRVTIPQRFALDLIGVDADGKAVRTDFRTSASSDWVGYGADVLAVADGVVRDAQAGMPEKAPFAPNPPTAPTLQAAGGNYVLLDIGRGLFAFYAHLQPNSLTIKTGDRVSRGQVLGRVGNSGSTTAPHLHFHISNTEALEGSEGLPFTFESFEFLGDLSAERAIGAETSDSMSFKPQAPENGLPLDRAVIRFAR